MSRARDIADSASTINALDNVTASGAELNILDGVTSTTAELNILDGVTSTASELNILDGVTSTASELNILDGVTSTASELNILDGVTATATEINKLDAVSRGSLIYGNASAETALLTKGSANQVLTSDGTDIAWANAAAGGTSGYQYLSTLNVSANASTIEIDDLNTSDYAAYKIFGSFRCTGNTSQLRMAFRTGTSDVGNYNGCTLAFIRNDATAWQGGIRQGGSAYIEVSNQYEINQYQIHYFSIEFRIPLSDAEFSGYNDRMGGFLDFKGYSNSNYEIGSFGEAFSNYNGTVNGIKLYLNTGTFGDGKFFVYGIKNS